MKNTLPLIPFFFIRHGQTDWNLKGILQGWTDIPLNETGHEQARNATPFLLKKDISRIVASPLMRAHKTAEIINEHLQVPLTLAENLKERSVGVLEGKPRETLLANGFFTTSIENGEHTDDFKARIAGALHEALDPEHTTLIVAHGGVYRAITEMMGLEEQRSHNCIPYLFIPPTDDQSSWTMHQLDTISTPIETHEV